jgi:hypothetical protein
MNGLGAINFFLPDDGPAENCNYGQIAALREKLNLVLFG